MKKTLVLTLLSTCITTAAYAGDSYEIQYTKIAPVIDAIGDDEVWSQAKTLTQFTLPWEPRLAPATEFKALWDEQAIYFRYRVSDANVTIGEGERGALDSDRVEIFLAKDEKLSEYYTMEIDATDQIYSAIGQYDMKSQKRTSLVEFQWQGLKTQSRHTDYGYLVEGAIPMTTLTQMGLWQDDEKTELLCALMRAEFTKTDEGLEMSWMTWNDPNLPQPNFHNPKPFGECELVK